MPSRSLADAHPTLAHAWVDIRTAYEQANPDVELELTCVYRSSAEQQSLYAQGRTKPGQIVTQIDGVKRLSNHNQKPSRALDFCVVRHGKVSWDSKDYEPVCVVAESCGLVAGGHWPNFKDWPHLELPDGA